MPAKGTSGSLLHGVNSIGEDFFCSRAMPTMNDASSAPFLDYDHNEVNKMTLIAL